MQFFRIQIMEGERWTRTAEGQHLFYVEEPFERGIFLANNSLKKGLLTPEQALVIDVQKFHLHADPKNIPEECKEEVAAALENFLHLNDSERDQLRKQFNYRRSRNRRLVTWLDQSTKLTIQAWWEPYAKQHHIPRNALFFIADYQRSYPYGRLAGQLLHTIRDRKDENTKQALPTGGLEAQFHKYLRGHLGKRRLLRSPRHSFATGELIAEPVDGANVHLTIDPYLQAIAEEEIALGVKRAKAKSGWVVMMNPHTGEIYALAQYPFFYPSNYQDYFNDPKRIEDSTVKAITHAYEPGSTMKPLTLAVALEANRSLSEKGQPKLFHPEEKIPCLDGRFPGRSKPIRDTREHRYLNMYMGLQKSSNIYMGRLVDRIVKKLGNEWYRGVLTDSLGLGKKTKIELPAESPGLVPRPGRLHPNGTLEWSVPTPYSLAMGYNLQVNSIQMLRAWSALANGGYLVEPTLLRKITREDEVLVDNTGQDRLSRFPKVLSDDTVNEVVKAMRYVSRAQSSGRRGNIHGYTEASKTGTSEKIVNGQYSKKKHFATFMGFTPVSDPSFVLLVAIDEPEPSGGMQYGGVCAGPVFRKIAQRSLEYLGVTPDDPHGFPRGDPRHDPEQTIWYHETKELDKLYRAWNEA